MLFKKKEKEKELSSQLVDVRKFILFSDKAIISIDCIRCVERDENKITINYRSNARTEATVITCVDVENAKAVMEELGNMINQEVVILGKD